MLTDARQHGLDRVGVEVAGTRHALERDIVDIAAGDAADLRHALVGRGRRQQEDQVQSMRFQRGGEFLAFLGRIVDDQHAVDAGRRRVAREAVLAMLDLVALDRIRIAHQHDRGRGVLLAEFAHHGQYLAQADAKAQRSLAGFLDHRAVGHRVRERHAELDHVAAGLDHGMQQFGRDVGVGEAGGDIGNQRLAALGLQLLESGFDAAHVGFLRHAGSG